MADSINTNEQMVNRINDVLSSKTDAVINIVNDKLTLSVFSLLEKNLSNKRIRYAKNIYKEMFFDYPKSR